MSRNAHGEHIEIADIPDRQLRANRRHRPFAVSGTGIGYPRPFASDYRRGGTTMKLPRRNFLHLIAGAATVALVMSPANHEALSQATRPIRIVVPYPPGGGADI